jgi:hypothetical protein
MQLELAIEAFAAINFLVIGVSHMLQPRAWVEFFERLRAVGRPGAFANGFLTLLMGSLIVAFHNVWTGIPAILTFMGWVFVLKSAIVFVSPETGLRSMSMAKAQDSKSYVVAGLVLVGVAALLCYHLRTWG